MKLSTRSEYALLALAHLARNYDRDLVKIEDISLKQKIPKKYLEHILLTLNKAGHLKSKRGAEGGYKLSRQPCCISMAEIIRLMDGALAPVESVSKYFYEPSPLENNPKIIAVLKEIRNHISDKLEKTSLADII